MSSTLFGTLRAVLLVSMTISVLPVPSTFSSEKAVIRALEASDQLCVVLWLPGSEAYRGSMWRSNLPFPVQVWTRFGNEQVEEMKKQHALTRKMVVVVPFSTAAQKLTIQERLSKDVMFVPLVRFLFVLKNGEDVPPHFVGEVGCLLAFLNQTTLDAPDVNFGNCSKRKTFRAGELLVPKPRTPGWENIKGKSLVGAIHYTHEKTGKLFPNRSVYGLVLQDAYSVLNITFTTYISKTMIWQNQTMSKIALDLLEKKFDVVMFPAPCSEVNVRFIDSDGFTYMAHLGFYSTQKKSGPALLGFGSGSLTISWYTGCCFILILAVYQVEARLMRRPTSSSSLALLLYATLLGRSTDEPGSYHHTVCRILLGFWLPGALFISTYVQSDLTSEVSVPTVSKPIETIDELQHLATIRKIYPCVETPHFEHEYIMLSQTGVLKTLKDSLVDCGDGCLYDNKTRDCFEKVEKGTHVFVWFESETVPKQIIRLQLYPGKDCLGTFPMAFMISKASPHVKEHNQLTRTLFETGLYVGFLRRSSTFTPKTLLRETAEVSIWNFALLYGCGCLVSVLCFAIELAIDVFT